MRALPMFGQSIAFNWQSSLLLQKKKYYNETYIDGVSMSSLSDRWQWTEALMTHQSQSQCRSVRAVSGHACAVEIETKWPWFWVFYVIDNIGERQSHWMVPVWHRNIQWNEIILSCLWLIWKVINDQMCPCRCQIICKCKIFECFVINTIYLKMSYRTI